MDTRIDTERNSTFRSLGNAGNFARDWRPTLMIERTRKLQNSSVKPWIE